MAERNPLIDTFQLIGLGLAAVFLFMIVRFVLGVGRLQQEDERLDKLWRKKKRQC